MPVYMYSICFKVEDDVQQSELFIFKNNIKRKNEGKGVPQCNVIKKIQNMVNVLVVGVSSLYCGNRSWVVTDNVLVFSLA